MKKRKVSLPAALGMCLILCSLCFTVGFQILIHTGTRESQMVVSQINELLPERTQGTPGIYQNTHMPVLEINRTDYIGILEIPVFGITLPVTDKWDSKKLYSAPSRFCGSVYDHTLVVGGSDYPQQFAFCDKIENGTLVMVTDMTGARFTYTVSCVDRAKHAEAKWLLDTDYDLVLFCRDAYSLDYIAVRCVLSYG